MEVKNKLMNMDKANLEEKIRDESMKKIMIEDKDNVSVRNYVGKVKSNQVQDRKRDVLYVLNLLEVMEKSIVEKILECYEFGSTSNKEDCFENLMSEITEKKLFKIKQIPCDRSSKKRLGIEVADFLIDILNIDSNSKLVDLEERIIYEMLFNYGREAFDNNTCHIEGEMTEFKKDVLEKAGLDLFERSIELKSKKLSEFLKANEKNQKKIAYLYVCCEDLMRFIFNTDLTVRNMRIVQENSDYSLRLSIIEWFGEFHKEIMYNHLEIEHIKAGCECIKDIEDLLNE